ncbi:DUF2155 domain-containing protein [Brevundimonas fluminis]|uniref:DUF2155 domain-containing protein n=1 Tax=Brevundimonas fluminis TaxID=2487274 RepID=UPI000F6588FC|nr:DUF2155 domain-containing protein [Brevundimonas fluminis]
MRRALRLALIAGTAVLALGGAGVTAALLDLPQDARPVQDPQDPPQAPPAEQAPAGDPAPERPVPVTPPGGADSIAAAVAAAQESDRAPASISQAEEKADEDEAEEGEVAVEAAPAEPEGPPGRRQRRRFAIVQAVDKVTAETMRFEVEVNGRPVAFNKTLIFRARACEVSASDERARDAVAYMEISAQPRGGAPAQDVRQLFRGWMFASSPGVSGLQHPVYDAWIVGCRG